MALKSSAGGDDQVADADSKVRAQAWSSCPPPTSLRRCCQRSSTHWRLSPPLRPGPWARSCSVSLSCRRTCGRHPCGSRFGKCSHHRLRHTAAGDRLRPVSEETVTRYCASRCATGGTPASLLAPSAICRRVQVWHQSWMTRCEAALRQRRLQRSAATCRFRCCPRPRRVARRLPQRLATSASKAMPACVAVPPRRFAARRGSG